MLVVNSLLVRKIEVIVDDVNFPMIYFPFIYFKSSAAPAYIARVMVLNAT
jgi:hypothetical protein